MRAVARLRLRTRRSGSRGKLALGPLLRPLLVLIACCLVWAAGPVAAQEKTPTPTAQELWDAYPLEASPTPAVPAAESPAAAERRVTAPAASTDTGGSSRLPLIAGVVLALGALALLLTFRPGRGRRSKPVSPGPPPPVATATPAPKPANGTTPAGIGRVVRQRVVTPKPGAETPAARPRRAETLLVSSSERPAAALPPDPRRGWSAEIEWTGAGDESRFTALARTRKQADRSVIVQSAPLEWPPTSAAAVQALTDAVAELERELLAAGWVALEPGAEWYAKRFGWKPVIVVEPAPPAVERAAVRAAAPQAPSGRFVREPSWRGSESLWRCELRWKADEVNPRFEAVAYEPSPERRVRRGGNTAAHKRIMLGRSNLASKEHRTELLRLVAALEADGWEQVGRGAKWYAARFVWRRPEPPPDHLDAPVPEPSRRPETA